jgi:anti-sigma regulatory factor (Ser/Thr protein kinase)
VGEPIWPGRSAAEIREVVRHEALVNVLFAGVDATVCCPYDSASLKSAVIADAHRSHPYRRVDGVFRSSPHYLDPAVVAALSERLPAAPAAAEAWVFHHREDMAALRRCVAARARRGGLGESGVQDLVLAVGEAVSNTLDHSGGPGTLNMWWDADTLVCEVADRGQILDPAAGRVAPSAQAERGRGVWIINQVCDLVELHSGWTGTRIRMHMRVSAGPI